MIDVIAAAALRIAAERCGVGWTPVLVVQREALWSKGVRAHFDSRTPGRIYIDPRNPDRRVKLIVEHEAEHWCRFVKGRSDWAMGEPVRP